MEDSSDESVTVDAAKPAGFFSTFSIADPDGSTRVGHGTVQRRNRRVFVCIPCHRRKIKCDKSTPCSRCVASGAPDECVYQQLQGRKQEAEPSPAHRPQTGASRSEVKACLEGVSHWKSAAIQFEEAWPYVVGSHPEWKSRYQLLVRHEALFTSSRSSNFPFGSAFSQNRAEALGRLPFPHAVMKLLESYFSAFESTHRLLHPQEFYKELNTLWINDSPLSSEWLAQLFMMLALGCQAAPDQALANTGQNPENLTDDLLDAAHFFFSQCKYITAPNLTTLRVLCLAAMARMMGIIKEAEVAQPVSLMGFVTRLAMEMHLHQKSSLLPHIAAFEAEMRKRIWVTVQLLDLDTAMRTGTSYLHREQDAEPPIDINDTDFSLSEHGWVVPKAVPCGPTDSTYQVKLAALLPILTDVIKTVNSPTLLAIDRERLHSWDAALRQKLQEAEATLSLRYDQPHSSPETIEAQIDFLRVLVHRALLALHFSYIRTSSFAIMQSSFELLRIQRRWLSRSPLVISAAEAQTRTSPSTDPAIYQSFEEPALPLSWLSDICHDDFGAAMLHLILAMREGDFETVKHASLPSRQGAMDILRESLEFKRGGACRSILHFREFVQLSLSVSCIASFQAGEPMLPGLLEAANEIEGLFLTQRSEIFAGEAELRLDPFGFGYPL